MSKFLSTLNAELVNSDSVWELRSPLAYQSDLMNLIVVPAGFQTDFASVPRVPFAYLAFGDKAHREAVIHDYLYRVDSSPNASFMEANKVFLEAMRLRGKPFYISYPMFVGVCAGGHSSYHKRKVTDRL